MATWPSGRLALEKTWCVHSFGCIDVELAVYFLSLSVAFPLLMFLYTTVLLVASFRSYLILLVFCFLLNIHYVLQCCVIIQFYCRPSFFFPSTGSVFRISLSNTYTLMVKMCQNVSIKRPGQHQNIPKPNHNLIIL